MSYRSPFNMKKYSIMALMIMISFLLIAGCNGDRLLMKNSLFSAPDDPSDFDPENTKISLRFGPSIQKIMKIYLSVSNKVDGLFNLAPKEAETPLGPSRNVNSMVTQRRLSSSSNSPGVGHMQMTRRKSEDIMKSHQSHGEDQVKQKRKTKRKLGSSPRPGDGN